MYRCSEFTKRTYKTGEVADILHLHYQTVIKYDCAEKRYYLLSCQQSPAAGQK